MREQETHDHTASLLAPCDPLPVEMVNADGRGRVVLICEHGGRHVPRALKNLGLSPEALEQHIAWDIGAAGVARSISQLLDAPLLLQPYSRLVIDCNRTLSSPDLIPDVADGTPVPGNRNLCDTDRKLRYDSILEPFHRAVTEVLDARPEPQRTVLLMIHSFTPRLLSQGGDRAMHLAFLYNRGPRLGRAMVAALRATQPDLVVAENEPYECNDLTDYAVPIHAEPRGLLHALVEIRNDQIRTAEGQETFARLLAQALTRALVSLEETTR